jgi:hypothetical protein
MNVVNKNEGPKIPYVVEGEIIRFDDEISINLSKCERDFPVHIDICRNEFDMLTFGLSNKYVAQIDIPGREYYDSENGTDEEGNPKIERVAYPFDIDNITLTLWEVL